MIGKSFTNALKNGEMIDIAQVENDMECGCICPACGEELAVRKRTNSIAYFMHARKSKCKDGNIVAIQILAKNIIERRSYIRLPKVEWNIKGYYMAMPRVIKEAQCIEIRNIELVSIFDNNCPHLVIDTEIGKIIIVISITKNVDVANIKKEYKGISILEVDISSGRTFTNEEFEKVLIEEVSKKSWIYNSKIENATEEILKCVEYKEMVSRGMACHVDDCPINSRVYQGKSYANMIDDCMHCDYCVAYGNDGVLCAGKRRITKYSDLFIAENVLIEREDRKIKKSMDSRVEKGMCKYCNGELVERVRRTDGKTFWGCSNFPYCHFTLEYEEYNPGQRVKCRQFNLSNNYANIIKNKNSEVKEKTIQKINKEVEYEQLSIFDYFEPPTYN